MNHVSKLDFTGQQIYVGMDVHKKNWSISIYTDQFEHKTGGWKIFYFWNTNA